MFFSFLSLFHSLFLSAFLPFFLSLGLLVKGKWQNLSYNFRREHAKISNTTTGSEALDDSPVSAWKYYEQLLVRVATFSSTKLQTNIPSVPSQATEPPDDNNQEDEYGMADDSIIDADLEVSSTIGGAQEAEDVGAVQKDPPTRPRMKPFNPSAWGHLNPSSYCDVGRLFYGVFKLWSKLQRKK